MDTYYIIHGGVRHLYYYNYGYTPQPKLLLRITRYSAAKLARKGGTCVYNLDSVHQQLLKSVYFSPSYSKYKSSLRHGVYDEIAIEERNIWKSKNFFTCFSIEKMV